MRSKSKSGRPSTSAVEAGEPSSVKQAQLQSDEGQGTSGSLQRYKDSRRRLTHQTGLSSTIAGSDGLFVGPDQVDELKDEQADVQNLDEPTMGQRLRGIRAAAAAAGDDSGDEEEQEGGLKRAPLPAGSLSLGETLTQALHSNDTAMLSGCLAHSDPTVIRMSVSRLSGPLAVRLLEHCIDRMGRGGRRSAGQLSSARARGIIEWVRATLTAHIGYLMSLPTLVHRLAQLHATLSARLASQDRLLALNGRLELVLSQIELRAAYASQQAIQVQGVKARGGRANAGKKGGVGANAAANGGREWVESSSDGEGSSEGADARMDVDSADEEEEEEDDNDEIGGPIQAEEEGEVQDIALGHDARRAYSDEDSDEADEADEDVEFDADEDDEDDDEDDDEEANGLLDLEAESTDGDDEDEDDEESDS